MTRDDMKKFEARLLDELAKRRRLGGFDANAMAILLLLESLYEIFRHLADKMPRPKSKETE